jgi:exoribonuclease R
MTTPQKPAPLVPIPADKLKDMLDQPIHLSWANPGCVWILKAIEGDTVLLETPKTKRTRRANAADACYVRRLEPPKPTLVYVFHNSNDRFRVAGDPDHCANLTLVTTVTVPEGEKPLRAAFRLTNHIDTDWTKNTEVAAAPGEHRSSSVGDVFEVHEPGVEPVRYILEDVGFSKV